MLIGASVGTAGGGGNRLTRQPRRQAVATACVGGHRDGVISGPSSTPRTRVLSLPAGHDYVRHAVGPATDVEVLADPVLDPAEPARWWPHPALEAAERPEVLDGADLVHVHFGYEHRTPGQVAEFLAAAALAVLASGRDPRRELSGREVEVLRLVADGCTNRAVGSRLGIGEATVKTHLGHVYEKLGVTDRASAVRTAWELGLV